MPDKEITIIIKGPLITSKSASWGVVQKQLYLISQEGIRAAVQQSDDHKILAEWLNNRVKLAIRIEFHLKSSRASNADLDSMVSDLFNPLVEGACGPRPEKKPIPQVRDSLFWKLHAMKRSVSDGEEKIVVKISPLNTSTDRR